VDSVTDPFGNILGFLDTRAATFLSSSSSVVLTRLCGPRSRPTTFFLVVPGIEPGLPDPQRRSLTCNCHRKIGRLNYYFNYITFVY
jgi:hypothetical protein